MRCSAPVQEKRAIRYRASRSPDPRCQRQGHYRLRGKHFCFQHLIVWARHYRILDRILAIPPREI